MAKTAGSCAIGTCQQSVHAGGPGCKLCDVVAANLVFWESPFACVNAKSRGGVGCESCDKTGRHRTMMANNSRRRMAMEDDVRKGDHALTKAQAKKARAKR